ncbi:CYFA0S03e04522g1_1 [Cyberlindnera fabianii]|uniref:proline--tRNA ligase n=1 Tax=Cyberlindnera fabianii TaxID=36022 RepID=A0A061AQX4_CYBFA|nr:CYFA0S03e04522g1_1 [Cyberlindnera fabianii]
MLLRRLPSRAQSTLSTHHIFAKRPLNKPPVTSIPTHVLLQDLGYVNQPSAGTAHWLPLGLRVLRRVENIIRTRMDEIGGEEFELSSLSGRALWEKTGRWGNTELFKMNVNDKDNADFCLAPTHEEEITELLRLAGVSYKDLPVLTYQMTRKYRFEKRPRGGLLRGREFLMKDAYSFDKDQRGALEMFDKVNGAYWKIFKDLKVPFEKAVADSGDIGGNLSHEWHFVHENGEDLLFKCDECGYVSNVEKTISLPEEGEYAESADVVYGLTKDGDTLVAAYYPKGRTFAPNMLKSEIEDLDLSSLSLPAETVIEKFSANEDEMILKKFVRIMDSRISDRTDLPDFPFKTFQKNNFTLITDTCLVEAVEGEYCEECGEGKLQGMNAIEVGHTFYLGKRYSDPMGAKFASQENKLESFEMGCYGIGVSRIVAAIAEMTRDDEGLVWPSSIAPYDVALVEAPKVDQEYMKELKESLGEKKLRLMEDKRDKIGFGAKMGSARMHGIPIIAVVGKKWPLVELEIRGMRWDQSKEEYEYEKIMDEKAGEYQWTVETDGAVEKHFVHKDHVGDVVGALLKDL